LNLLSSVAIDVVSAFGCLIAVDLLSGLIHWLEDTWTAPGRSALLDRWVVTDNIEHHRRPGTIRAGRYWQTNRVCIVLAASVGAVLLLCGVHAWQAYVIVLLASQSNQIHLWAHSANPPRLIAWLQRLGVLQSAAHHAEHHKRPYASRFCTVTNYLNPLLDRIAFWRGLEWCVRRCGVTMHRATPARQGF
jgi:ubiquitin-conjugating enzyme E2 variant